MSYEEVESSSESSACERCGFFPCDCSDPGRVDPWTGEAGPSTAAQVDTFLPDEEIVPCHQPEEPLSLEEEKPFVRTEAEKDLARVLKFKQPARMTTSGVAPKPSRRRERSPSPPRRVVRLDQFFDEHDTPMAQRVTLCRTYASFVASTLPKKHKK